MFIILDMNILKENLKIIKKKVEIYLEINSNLINFKIKGFFNYNELKQINSFKYFFFLIFFFNGLNFFLIYISLQLIDCFFFFSKFFFFLNNSYYLLFFIFY